MSLTTASHESCLTISKKLTYLKYSFIFSSCNLYMSHMRHDSHTYETWHILVIKWLVIIKYSFIFSSCNLYYKHLYILQTTVRWVSMRHDSYETWLTHIWDMTHTHTPLDPSNHVEGPPTQSHTHSRTHPHTITYKFALAHTHTSRSFKSRWRPKRCVFSLSSSLFSFARYP